ncbi:MAG: hypothetical protein M1838_002415 [Thelocarpon superellum]|nr:MAG: hypothetical protein M1838_002415 [Thelocarpon superellum]
MADGVEMRHRGVPDSMPSTTGPKSENPTQNDLDAWALARAGKRQQLKRNFGTVSVVAFTCTILASWEAVASSFNAGLINGGPSSLVYGYLLSWVGILAVTASMAELASISPTAGAQYHWVAQFAPEKWSAPLSFFAGWLLVIGWSSGCSAASSLAATEIQGLIALNNPDYVPQRWQASLLYWGILIAGGLINVYGIRILPYLESAALVLHVAFFFILIVPLVYLAPQSANHYVFATFDNDSGWDNNGVSWLIGLTTSLFALSGIDCACHISEEVQNASKVVPRAMMYTMLLDGALAFGFLLVLLYSIGDVNSVLGTPTGYPVIQIFYNTTGSLAATNAMTALVISGVCFAILGQLAAASRVTWAFSRDGGIPFSKYFAHVDPKRAVPHRAVTLIVCLSFLWGLINLGSTTAFSAVISFTTSVLNISYITPIIVIALRRMGPKPVPWGPWRLGRFGLAINCVAIAFVAFTSVFLFFPTYQPVTPVNMNYASLLFGAALIFALLCWMVYGRKNYHGPLREIQAQDFPVRLWNSSL